MAFRDDLIAVLRAHAAPAPPVAGTRPVVAPELRAFVSAHGALRGFAPGNRRLGRQFNQADFGALAEWLTERTADVGAAGAVDDLVLYLEAPDFRCEFILAVGGLVVDAPIALADDVTLRPYSRTDFLAEDGAIASFPEIGGHALDTISAAFTLMAPHPKHHVTSTPPFDAGYTAAVQVEDAAWERLRRARACVALAAPSPSYEVGTAIVVDPAVPCAHTSTARSWFMERDGGRAQALRGAVVETAQALHGQFIGLPRTEQAHLLVPMHRLERALHPRAEMVDVAIDLGIALEAALLAGDAAAELAYRLSVRGACLVGTSTADRCRRQRQLSALYVLRSKAVHTGALPAKPPKGLGRTNQEALAIGISLAAEIIRALIARGGAVAWDEIVLGPPPASG